MSQLHFFVTVGVSVFEQSRCWKWQVIDDNERKRLQALKYDEFVRETWEKNAPSDPSKSMYQYLEGQRDSFLNLSPSVSVCNHFDSETWHEHRWRALPAEIATIYKLCEAGHIKQHDTITLVHGTDDRGSQAAELLKEMLDMLNRASDLNPALLAKPADPIRLDWNPDDHDRFSWALQKALEEGVEKHLAYARFVLTGGYKASGLFIAHWLGRRNKVQGSEAPAIVVLHETSDEFIIVPDGVEIRPGHKAPSIGVPEGNA